jgi:TonB-linked SusC/RagA family outer membrane protein
LKYKFEDGTLAPGDYYPSAPYQLSRRDQKNSLDNMTLSVGGHWEILPGLSFDPQVSVYEIDSDSRSFQKSLWTSTTAFNTIRSASGAYSKYKQKQADAVFSYRKSVKQNHNIEAMAGFSYFGTKSSALSASGRGASTDLIPTLNAASEPVSVSGSESEEVILGYFSRVNYDYKQKYLISLNGRYDGASKLGDTNKWGFFPGISLGWNVDKEKFWKMFPENLLQLKLRGSYGVNGNLSGLGAYQAQGQYSVGSRYGGNAAIQNTILANQNLQWEQSKTLDFGLDLGLFDQRLGIIFDVYRRETENLLTSLVLPQATGFSSVFTNYGSLENKGVELELNAQVLPAASAFKWNVAFNIARNKNKILKLPENGTENNRVGGFYVWDASRGDYAWLGGLQEGGNIGDWYAYKQVGVYSTDNEAAAGPLDMIVALADKSKYGGDVNWQDLDNNKVIDARDRVYVGNPYPLWTGGFSNTLSFKNFNLGIRLDYATGHTIYNWSRAEQLAQYGAFGNVIDEVLRSWQKQGDITDVPRYYWADQQGQMNIARGNSQYYEKGDYLALREVTLSYNLPAKLLQKVKINSSRIYVTGNNLHYFTAYKGLSPEVGRQDNGNYPIPRNLIVGANISF